MTKHEFLFALQKRLSGFPRDEVAERLNFYREMIEDRMEEGLSEEEAVAAAGNIDEIVAQITAEIPLTKLAKEQLKPKRQLYGWEILLLVLGFPLWFPLLIAAFSVVLSLYISLWSVVISLWAVFVSLVGCFAGLIIAGIVLICTGNTLPGIALIGASFLCAGLAIFLFFGCLAATKGTALLAKKFVLWLKGCFIKKEDAK